MKKLLKILAAFIIIVAILFIIVWGFHGFATKESSNYYPPEKKSPSKNIEDGKQVFQERFNKIESSPITKKELDNLIPTEYINYTYVDDSKIPDDIKLEIKEKSINLNSYGSFSKGKISHEFTNTPYYKNRLQELGGYENLKEKLSFKPTDLNTILNDYELIGGDYSGTYTENKGFNSVFRSYQNNNSSIEINEIALNKNSDKINFFKENINSYINSSPATIERIDNGNIYNISWISQDRLYNMSSKGLNEGQVSSIAQKIDSLTK